MHVSTRFTLLLLCAATALSACQKEKVVVAACRQDSDCDPGLLCENYQCVPKEAKNCELVLDGNPILQPAPHVVDFGDVDSQQPQLQTIGLHNIGNCTLTLFEATLANTTNFNCDLCSDTFPKEVFPGRSIDLNLTFTATGVGPYDTSITFLSDDKEYPTLLVPVHATYIGTPNLVAAPNPVDFGYVAQGRSLLKTVQLSNQGTGVAPITITALSLAPAGTQDFELTPITTLPTTLLPAAQDSRALVTAETRYTPRTTATHAAELVVTTTTGEIRIPLKGTAETPPKISINPTSIALGDTPLGTSNVHPLTIVNQGGAPLHVTYAWGGTTPSTDLWATPAIIPDIAPGAYVELQVAVTATAAQNYNGLLILSTNDPSKPSVTVPVTAVGVPGPGSEVVKIEMTYDNGADGTFDNDLRKVDLTLEHPFGYVCNKAHPNPTNWSPYGDPSWFAFPPKDEPQRIVLANSQADGTWRVQANYLEDCSSVPTALIAGILGITTDALIGYWSGGAITVDPNNVANLIASMCLSHSSSTVDVKVYINGVQIGEKNATVTSKGSSTYVLDLIRTNGHFTMQ